MAITNEDLIIKLQQGNLYFANLMDEYVDDSVYSLDVNYELFNRATCVFLLLTGFQFQLEGLVQ